MYVAAGAVGGLGAVDVGAVGAEAEKNWPD